MNDSSKESRFTRPGGDEKLLMALVRVAELFKRRSGSIFARHGLSFSQYNTLRVLEVMDQGSASLSEISRQLLVSTPNLSGIAKRLEKEGFAVRTRDETDERKTLLCITDRGRYVVAGIRPSQERNIEELLGGFSTRQKEDFLTMLRDMLILDR